MSSEKFHLFQQILEARYDFETCDEPLKGEAADKFEKLVDHAIEGTSVSRMELVEAIRFHMEEYRKARRIAERRKQHLR